MNKKIVEFIESLNNKKRFNLIDLERFVIDSYGGQDVYLTNGGYISLYNHIISLEKEGKIKVIVDSSYNGLNPALKTRWQVISKECQQYWDKAKIMQFSDKLDFSYYMKNPTYQNDIEWKYVERIYLFLTNKDSREWLSLEERSLELFDDEKFLKNRKDTNKGKYGILSRLNISYDDLKVRKYGEMFIYWNRGTSDIKRVIILENHSTFFSYKRVAEKGMDIFGVIPDIIIYGEGKKIENSLSFLDEIADTSKLNILYFGDVDSEGFGIYYRLRKRYPEVKIELQHEAYYHLINECKKKYPLESNNKNNLYLEYFIEEFKYAEDEVIIKLKDIWNGDCRIPQELINYEYLLKVKI